RRLYNYAHKNGVPMVIAFRVALILYLKKVEEGKIKLTEAKNEEVKQDTQKEKQINEKNI
ncbi:MAG: hypothetical protein QXV57_09935, partial [Thermoproteota archaeon]